MQKKLYRVQNKLFININSYKTQKRKFSISPEDNIIEGLLFISTLSIAVYIIWAYKPTNIDDKTYKKFNKLLNRPTEAQLAKIKSDIVGKQSIIDNFLIQKASSEGLTTNNYSFIYDYFHKLPDDEFYSTFEAMIYNYIIVKKGIIFLIFFILISITAQFIYIKLYYETLYTALN